MTEDSEVASTLMKGAVEVPSAQTSQVTSVESSADQHSEASCTDEIVSGLDESSLTDYFSRIKRGVFSLQLNGSCISLLSCYHFPLDELIRTIVQEDAMGRSMESVVVRSTIYCKKNQSLLHEFIIFELENTQIPGIRNYTVLDRSSFNRGTRILSSGPDEFRFACDGNKEKFLTRCNLMPYDTVETIEFQQDNPLPFYLLAIIALATSLQRERYHLLKANCYWFSGLVWEYILQMYPEATHETLQGGVRGKFGNLFAYTPDLSEQDKIGAKVQTLLSQIELNFVRASATGQEAVPEDLFRDSPGIGAPVDEGGPNIPSQRPYRPSLLSKFIEANVRNQNLYALRKRSERASRKPSSLVYEERDRQIFPRGFDLNSSSSSSQRPYYAFDPERLYDVLTSGYNPEHHVEHIIVKSASYCKQKTGPKHEFIILEVTDQKLPGLRNWIALDRNNGDPPTRATRFNPATLSSFVARDEFRVSYDGNRARLLAQCGLKDYETLETLEFKPNEPLLLYQLATLTRAVSLRRDTYKVLTANCYWFPGLIWDCMIRMSPQANRRVVQAQIRGVFLSWLRLNINIAELEVTYEYVDKELLDIENRFEVQKQRWTPNYENKPKEEHRKLWVK